MHRSAPTTGTSVRLAAAALVAALGGCMTRTTPPDGFDAPPPDIQALWDYSDPATSEQRFLQIMPAARQTALETGDQTLEAVLLSQIARTHSLRRQFSEAHAVLDVVKPMLARSGREATVRYLLERGRTHNSAGEPSTAEEYFERAWHTARSAKLDGLAVDAAHMIAIVGTDDDALQWNQTALELAESSDDPDARRWLGSLHNNLGWTCHAGGDYQTALSHFEQALEAREEAGKPDDIRVARWCIARCLRSLGRVDEALVMQMMLLDHANEAGAEPDGYVSEELAECLHALGRVDEAQPHFKRAFELLSEDAWLVEQEPARIERLRVLSQRKTDR